MAFRIDVYRAVDTNKALIEWTIKVNLQSRFNQLSIKDQWLWSSRRYICPIRSTKNLVKMPEDPAIVDAWRWDSFADMFIKKAILVFIGGD